MEWTDLPGFWGLLGAFKRRAFAAVLVVAAGIAALAPNNAAAQSAGAIIVGSDRGGFIRARLAEIQAIRAEGRAVEIRGKVCFSTCTMYLGVEDVCVSPTTTFGFHGPGMAIGRMTPAQFDYVSRVIASHYPEPIADWYLAEGRTRTSGLYKMSGENLIRLGVRACPRLAIGNR